jgi:uncharacterized membrane protein
MAGAAQRRTDWVGSIRAGALAWWIPHGVLIAGLFVEARLRTAIWIVALAWMGTACILNARRCGRTHCRFTGPFYLVMIVPVGVLGLAVSARFWAWAALAALIVFGGKIIWWATERAWGKFSSDPPACRE